MQISEIPRSLAVLIVSGRFATSRPSFLGTRVKMWTSSDDLSYECLVIFPRQETKACEKLVNISSRISCLPWLRSPFSVPPLCDSPVTHLKFLMTALLICMLFPASRKEKEIRPNVVKKEQDNYFITWRRPWQPTPVFLPGESHRGAWQPIVHRVVKSWTWLKKLGPHKYYI